MLAALLIDADASADIEPEHFYFDCNARVYEAILAVSSRDIEHVADCLRVSGRMQQVGGALYLAELLMTEPAWDLECFAYRIRDAWRRRKMLGVMQQVTAELYSGTTGADDAWRRVKECAA